MIRLRESKEGNPCLSCAVFGSDQYYLYPNVDIRTTHTDSLSFYPWEDCLWGYCYLLHLM